ncbi:alpha,alpha-trehalase TreA [Brenneria populi]|uniref:Periplasmic trehalase n=1 Tax=Brenneria populi TaxID=1505588 RepID=A0ABU6JKU5_9GAMM|nr:alpha,alpha-trehalase TreA [Brenneria populi Li et al. 2015]
MISAFPRGIKTPLPPLILALSLVMPFAATGHPDPAGAPPLPPDVLLGPLFSDVQQARLFPDQKTFADAVPKQDPAVILARYARQKNAPDFDFPGFVASHFTLPQDGKAYVPPAGQTLRQHIDGLWRVLTRAAPRAKPYDSLLPLPYGYVVPGGRFREIYYWDSYFTMLGLAESGDWTLVRNMTDNFAHEIDSYGHIPNGNRTYYLSRSQPPFFSFMVELLAQHEGEEVYARYLPQLKKEYYYWMRGSVGLPNGQARDRAARLDDGSVLNRYWDERDTPRPESYMEDMTTASKATDRPASEVYRDLRAGAASGWDFSSRWLRDPQDLSSIHTTDIIPVDLNSLLFHLEQTLAHGAEAAGDPQAAQRFRHAADARKRAVNRYLWHERGGYYSDYDWRQKAVTPSITAAAAFPLYVDIAPRDRAASTGEAVRKQLLKEGGLATTTINTDQQWDAPNGWAPLQWVAVAGFSRYGQEALAQAIGSRFLSNVQTLYDAEHKLVEKYVVEGPGFGSGGGGGEYALQDGFGWTNGVTLKLMARYCADVAACRRAEHVPAR